MAALNHSPSYPPTLVSAALLSLALLTSFLARYLRRHTLVERAPLKCA
jgi:hypothetical protein